MIKFDFQSPYGQQQSLFISVALSIQQLSLENQQKAKILALFRDACDLDLLQNLTQWSDDELDDLVEELLATNLVSMESYNNIRLNPELPAYFKLQWSKTDLQNLWQQWAETMLAYVDFLNRSQNAEMVTTLMLLHKSNLLELLSWVRQFKTADELIRLSCQLHELYKTTHQPQLMKLLAQIQKQLQQNRAEDWEAIDFEISYLRIEELSRQQAWADALPLAEQLWRQTQLTSNDAFEDAPYQKAMAQVLFARILRSNGRGQEALPHFTDANRLFESLALSNEVGEDSVSNVMEMNSLCLSEQGHCWSDLGQLEQAILCYQSSIQIDEQIGDSRGIATNKAAIATVLLKQKQHSEALTLYFESSELFKKLGDLAAVARIWHQIAIIYQQTGDIGAAFHANQQSLSIKKELDDIVGQAKTLSQLGVLSDIQGDYSQAISLHQQAIQLFIEIGDAKNQSFGCNNLAHSYFKLEQRDKARQLCQQALALKQPFGDITEPWTSWALLSHIELAENNVVAANEANQHAIHSFLAYRRAGGENHDGSGRLAKEIGRLLSEQQLDDVSELIQQLIHHQHPYFISQHPYLQALATVISGVRNPALVETDSLNYMQAAEILLLLEALAEQP